MRAAPISRRLTLDDAVTVWRLRWAGNAQHVIAARLGVNPGRVSEVLTGKRFPDAEALASRAQAPSQLVH